MAVKTSDELYIVNVNIDRYHAYRAQKAGKSASGAGAGATGALERICQGVYMRLGDDPDKIFERYGLRIASYLMPQASLSYCTAFLKKPYEGRVFLTGQYQYSRPLFGSGDRFVIVQSIGEVDPDNPKLHTLETFKDKLGTFQMLVDTPELTLLNEETSTKRHAEKHLNAENLDKLIKQVVKKHGGKAQALSALEAIAGLANRQSEFQRVIKLIFPPAKSQSDG